MRPAHDDAAFLAGSPTRADVLDGLVERPRDRAALADATDASQPTLSRTLAGLETRGWIERDGDTYRATVIGRLVAGRYRSFLDALERAQRLAIAAPELPVESFGFDLDRLLEAEIVVPSTADPLAPTRRAAAHVRDARDVRILTHQVAPDSVDALRDRAGEQTVRAVVTPAVVETMLADDGLATAFDSIVAAGDVTVRVHPDVPLVLAICDDLVGMGAPDATGAPTAVIESRDAAVYAWAEATFDDYWARAEALERPPSDR